MKKLIAILKSFWTALALFAASIALSLAGSLSLPRHLAFFSGIDDTPLLKWLGSAGDIGATWWIYALIAAIGLLSAATAVCTAYYALETVRRGGGWRLMLAKLSPQLLHIGVLLVLMGHFLTAAFGAREDVSLVKGGEPVVIGGVRLLLSDVMVKADAQGYETEWRAMVSVDGGAPDTVRQLLPLKLRQAGVTLVLKSVNPEGPAQSALFRVIRDPGVLWALAGGLMVIAGAGGIITARSIIRTEGA